MAFRLLSLLPPVQTVLPASASAGSNDLILSTSTIPGAATRFLLRRIDLVHGLFHFASGSTLVI